MAATELVILVDEKDQIQGSAEKLEAHRHGWCHRAFSVFVYRMGKEREFLLQQRASHKYHSPNLWTNTCCSHPRPGENVQAAAERRLFEELGLKLTLKPIGQFHYIAHFDNGLIENEFDHVFIGEMDAQIIQPNPAEIQNYQWVTVETLKKRLQENPLEYTPWLAQVVDIVKAHTQALDVKDKSS